MSASLIETVAAKAGWRKVPHVGAWTNKEGPATLYATRTELSPEGIIFLLEALLRGEGGFIVTLDNGTYRFTKMGASFDASTLWIALARAYVA